MTLDTAKPGQRLCILDVKGERSFRRRLLELGLLPGTPVAVLRIAPLGDPIELMARGTRLSIRKREAQQVTVEFIDAATRNTAQRDTSPGADA